MSCERLNNKWFRIKNSENCPFVWNCPRYRVPYSLSKMNEQNVVNVRKLRAILIPSWSLVTVPIIYSESVKPVNIVFFSSSSYFSLSYFLSNISLQSPWCQMHLYWSLRIPIIPYKPLIFYSLAESFAANRGSHQLFISLPDSYVLHYNWEPRSPEIFMLFPNRPISSCS